VLLSLLYAAARLLLEILIVRSRPKARLEAEVLALRYQLRVLERQVGLGCTGTGRACAGLHARRLRLRESNRGPVRTAVSAAEQQQP
jgi:hypothetical protein